MKLFPIFAPLRRRAVWLSLTAGLAGTIAISGVALQGTELTKQTEKARDETPARAEAKMMLRGPEQVYVGQRFTFEVLIHNMSRTPLQDVEFHAQFDAALEQPSKAREFRETVTTIAPDDLHVVRVTLTPLKHGPGGIDITMRAKNGATQSVRHVIPIPAADYTPPPREANAPALEFKITTLREQISDQTGILLVNIVNADRKPMAKPLDLVVAYGTLGRDSQLHVDPKVAVPAMKIGMRPPGEFGFVAHANPTRKVQISLPVLEPGESRTFPVRVTPRRIGEIGVAIAEWGTPTTVIATARFGVKFSDAVERLLPVRTETSLPVRVPKTLAEVPEVSLEDAAAKNLPADEAFERVAHLIEKINHVNKSKIEDAYMEVLVKHRPDLRGMPFTMGKACRLSDQSGQQFFQELTRLRQAMTNPKTLATRLPNPSSGESEDLIKSRVAVLNQVVEPEGPHLNKEMVKYLATLSHKDATRSLAKLAICAEDAQVREDALKALATRRDKDFTDILVSGLSYPWPAVAERTADAIVTLKLTDLASKLVDVLDQPDPRAPRLQEQDGKKVPVVRELVRVNHLRNCLLCHSPASVSAAGLGLAPGGISAPPNGRQLAVSLTAPVPLPNQTLPTPTPQGGYGSFAIPDTLVRFDVTYLRQDFSVKLPVANASPWPAEQRFDFLVRSRELSEKDAEILRDLLRPATGELSPYQRAAVGALRKITGRDAEPTAGAWRQVVARLETK